MGRPARALDIGQRFERLTVVAQSTNAGGHIVWRCLCDCGATVTSKSFPLVAGRTKSCGCYQRSMMSASRTTHGDTAQDRTSPEYRSWYAMKRRCSNMSGIAWANYGGRGISVCERWMKFENFLADMGRKPSTRHSIDRVDNDGNYEMTNCRWATPIEQRANQRRTVSPLHHGNEAHS